jgi:hypothetical protein
MKKRKSALSYVEFLASGVLFFVITFESKYFSYSSATAKPNWTADCPGPGCPSLNEIDQQRDLRLLSTLKPQSVLNSLDIYSNSLDIYNEEATLSTGTQRIREGGITIGKPRVQFLASSKPLNGKIDWDYYSVYIPYSLQSLDGGRRYILAVFKITLKDPRSIAHDIFPPNSIKIATKVRKIISFTADMKFNYTAVALSGGTTTQDTNDYVVLTPILTPLGKGESQFSWEHKGINGQYVSPGIKHAAIVLKAPHGLRRIMSDLDFRVNIYDPDFNSSSSSEPSIDSFPFTLELIK